MGWAGWEPRQFTSHPFIRRWGVKFVIIPAYLLWFSHREGGWKGLEKLTGALQLWHQTGHCKARGREQEEVNKKAEGAVRHALHHLWAFDTFLSSHNLNRGPPLPPTHLLSSRILSMGAANNLRRISAFFSMHHNDRRGFLEVLASIRVWLTFTTSVCVCVCICLYVSAIKSRDVVTNSPPPPPSPHTHTHTHTRK